MHRMPVCMYYTLKTLVFTFSKQFWCERYYHIVQYFAQLNCIFVTLDSILFGIENKFKPLNFFLDVSNSYNGWRTFTIPMVWKNQQMLKIQAEM